jgi:hypothetical protein
MGNRMLKLNTGVRIALIFGVSHLSWKSWSQQVRAENLKEAVEMSKAEEVGAEYKRSHIRHHELAMRRSEGAHCLYKNDLGIFYREAPYYDVKTQQNMFNGKSFVEIKTSRSKLLDPNEFKRLDSSRIFACESVESKNEIGGEKKNIRADQTYIENVVQPWMQNEVSSENTAEVEIPVVEDGDEALVIREANYEKLVMEKQENYSVIKIEEILMMMANDKSIPDCKNLKAAKPPYEDLSFGNLVKISCEVNIHEAKREELQAKSKVTWRAKWKQWLKEVKLKLKVRLRGDQH